jgi:hypothetical protein
MNMRAHPKESNLPKELEMGNAEKIPGRISLGAVVLFN